MTSTQTPHPVELPLAAPTLHHPRGHRLVRAGAALWRVLAPSGSVSGHLRIVADPLGVRYRAERLHRATGRFRELGVFWSADEAVACLRDG